MQLANAIYKGGNKYIDAVSTCESVLVEAYLGATPAVQESVRQLARAHNLPEPGPDKYDEFFGAVVAAVVAGNMSAILDACDLAVKHDDLFAAVDGFQQVHAEHAEVLEALDALLRPQKLQLSEVAREGRARRLLKSRGYSLVKSRRRDPRAVDYGTYLIVDHRDMVVAGGDGPFQMHLADVEAWAASP